MLYRASEGITDTPHATALSDIEQIYHVEIVYGQRTFVDKNKNITTLTDVILVNVSNSYTKFGRVRLNGISMSILLSNQVGMKVNGNMKSMSGLPNRRMMPYRSLSVEGRGPRCSLSLHEFMGMPLRAQDTD